MRISAYKRIAHIASRIRTEVLSQYFPGDRLPAELKISEMLGETQSRVHRALELLIEEGIVYSSGGRRGMFFTPMISKHTKTNTEAVNLKFSIPAAVDPIQTRFWERVTEMFHMIDPQLKIELIRNPYVCDDIGADCYLYWLPLINHTHFMPLDLSMLPESQNMVQNIIHTGELYGEQYGVPIFHSPAVYWAHRNMLKKCDLNKKNFTSPLDVFSWGKILEEANLCIYGFSFFGFFYHAANWGVEIMKEGDYTVMDFKKVKKFITDCKPYFDKFINSTDKHRSNLFFRGQLGIFAQYLNALSLTEKRFELLGQPLKKNGFANQSVFFLGIGKNTKHKEIVYDFIRFVLMEHIQELFFAPRVHFSVLENLYRKQYKELCERTGVQIPPWDYRGVGSLKDPDLRMFGHAIRQDIFGIFSGEKNPDKIIKKICRVYIPDQIQSIKENASDYVLNQYKAHFDYLKKKKQFN